MWNIRLFNSFNMRERGPAPHSRLEGVDVRARAARQDLNPPIRQVCRAATDAQPLGTPLREPAESDPLHASRDDQANGPLVPFPARGSPAGPGSTAGAAHGDAARRRAVQT